MLVSDTGHEVRAPEVVDVVVQVQRVLASLPPSQYESAVRRILASVSRIEADRRVTQAANALADIPLYENRSDRRETAASFLERHYRELIDHRLIFADDLRRHDARLYRALSAYLASRQSRISEIIAIRPVGIRRRKA